MKSAAVGVLALSALADLSGVQAFVPGSVGLGAATSLQMSTRHEHSSSSAALTRRGAITLGSFAALGLGLAAPAEAKRKGDVKGLFEDDGTETKEEKMERKRKEREEYRKQREAAEAEVEAKAAELRAGKDIKEAEMGTNLRGDYYYPTSRKRYLPRVKRAYDTIEEALASGKLDKQSLDLEKIDAALPMKLYVSALSGGGLSINSPFMSEMKKAAEAYDTNYKTLDGALRKKNGSADTAKILETLKADLLSYRAAGKPVGLTGDDWGVGEVPDCKKEKGGVGKMSACAVGSSFGNANPNLYNRNAKD